MIDLSVEFCGVRFQNPLVLASGVLGITASSLLNVVQNGAGGVTTKSIWMKEHVGHKNPVIIANEHYMLNAVGLSDAGITKAREELPKFLKAKKAPLILNIVAGKAEEFGEIAEEAAKLSPHIIEVNISCPNVEDELGKPFACSAVHASKITELVKKRVRRVSKIPISIKLSPNVEDIVSIAKAVVEAGADALTVANSVGPGMAIDLETRQPVLTNKVGGVTGPAMKPIIVKHVHDIHRALPRVPIIGLGGVCSGRDAIEMMMAGATLVGVGTAVYYRGVEVFGKMVKEMNAWCSANNVKKLRTIIGTVKT